MLLVSLLFWGFLASFVIHILDESLLNGRFVKWIVDNFWPTYSDADVLLVQRRVYWSNCCHQRAL
jgi:hypothetical protein